MKRPHSFRIRIRKDVGYYLRMYRAVRDWTAAEAAEYFGIGPSHWSLMEAGLRKPSPELAQRLCEATGAPLGLLLGIETPKWATVLPKTVAEATL